jgi:hypothetical protein
VDVHPPQPRDEDGAGLIGDRCGVNARLVGCELRGAVIEHGDEYAHAHGYEDEDEDAHAHGYEDERRSRYCRPTIRDTP